MGGPYSPRFSIKWSLHILFFTQTQKCLNCVKSRSVGMSQVSPFPTAKHPRGRSSSTISPPRRYQRRDPLCSTLRRQAKGCEARVSFTFSRQRRERRVRQSWAQESRWRYGDVASVFRFRREISARVWSNGTKNGRWNLEDVQTSTGLLKCNIYISVEIINVIPILYYECWFYGCNGDLLIYCLWFFPDVFKRNYSGDVSPEKTNVK